MTEDEVLALLVAGVREVLGADPEDLRLGTNPPASAWRSVRFDEDLHADSLDLVEIVEGVERTLARRGLRVALPDDALSGMGSLGDAAARMTAAARQAEGT